MTSAGLIEVRSEPRPEGGRGVSQVGPGTGSKAGVFPACLRIEESSGVGVGVWGREWRDQVREEIQTQIGQSLVKTWAS